MPVIIPSPNAGIYDTASSILNSVRFRLNDRMPSLAATSGKILDETQASTQQAFNNGWRSMQNSLCDAGFERFHGDVVIERIPATLNMDPSSVCSLSWFNIFDGINSQTAPVLPSDLILPLWMSERPSVVSGVNSFAFPDVNRPNMICMLDGLQSCGKRQRNCQWEWRGDAIYYPGATIPVDFRIRYRRRLPDIDNVGDTRWWNVSVPILDCQDALSWRICSEFAAAKAVGAEAEVAAAALAVAVACEGKAMDAIKLLANRDAMKTERVAVRRIPYGGGSRGQGGSYGGGWGY